MSELLERAIQLAIQLHEGQVDDEGLPYILHPMGVMLDLWRQGADEATLIVAILHNTLENCDITDAFFINRGFSPEIIIALRLLTKSPSMPYMYYLKEIKESGSKIALAVEIADMKDNSSVRRMAKSKVSDPETYERRLKKYTEGWKYLTGYDLLVQKGII